jgi:hypothetical protein
MSYLSFCACVHLYGGAFIANHPQYKDDNVAHYLLFPFGKDVYILVVLSLCLQKIKIYSL